ncbi:MAG: 8-amino-7-oxononanoate synthase [Pirellulales bacterium]|nr:8-amino-7-oxononanoate synthase [Pirellulales bacterium]
MPDPLDWIDDELTALDAQHLRRGLVTREGPQDAVVTVGQSHNLINFGSNDYLGLAADRRLNDAAAIVAQNEGWGAGASPLVAGRSLSHEQLERRLAEFKGAEAGLVFSSGFAANVGTVAALVERGDAIFSDANNHASLIDGCRLSRAEVHIYRHADVDHLAELLSATGRYRRRLIVTDALFSMDGDLAPLPQIAALAAQHGAMLMVDEAHATGVFGQRGRGVSEHLGVEDAIHVHMGTLSKALGSTGGFVVGQQKLIDWLTNRARAYVFSTALSSPVAAATIAAIELVQSESQRRWQLLDRAGELRERLSAQGWNIGRSCAQIIPIYLGDAEQTMDLAQTLRGCGLFVPGIRPPSVPTGKSLLRISLTWLHTPAMLDTLLQALAAERH